MYLYAYDNWVTEDQRYEKDITHIENRLTDLGIAGTTVRLGLFRDHVVALKSEIRKGNVVTLVAVGDDTTLQKVLDAVGEDKKMTVGYIPMTSKNGMANLLGIPTGVAACEILSARLVENIDAGEVNGRRFLHSATLEADNVTCICEESYALIPQKRCRMELRNLAAEDAAGIVSPSDGKLTLIVRIPVFALFSKKEYISRIPVRKIFVKTPKKTTVVFDGEKMEGTEFHFSAIPGRVRMIIGREKKF